MPSSFNRFKLLPVAATGMPFSAMILTISMTPSSPAAVPMMSSGRLAFEINLPATSALTAFAIFGPGILALSKGTAFLVVSSSLAAIIRPPPCTALVQLWAGRIYRPSWQDLQVSFSCPNRSSIHVPLPVS